MHRFAHTEYLYLLYLIPILVLLFWFYLRTRNKAINNFATKKMQDLIIPFQSKTKLIIKFSLVTLAIGFIILGIANPQIGAKLEEVKQVGIDVFILLDVSKSMKAEDISPNRLEKAKYDISRLINKLRGDRVGLVIFAGEAYVQFPLTTDYSAANLFLSAVDVNSVPQQGTNIGAALKIAHKSFKQDAETQKAIVIITDGEDHEGEVESTISEIESDDIRIYTIGLGTPSGVPIPITNRGTQVGFIKDKNDQVVLSKLDEATLINIAKLGNGKYYRGTTNDDVLNEIYNELAKLETAEFGTKKITEYEDRFYYFLAPALFLLLIEFFISNKKSKLFIKLEKMSRNNE